MAREWQFDAHRVQFEPPNLFVIRWKGPVTEENVDRLFACFDEVDVPKTIALADLTQSEIPGPRARAKMSRMEMRTAAIAALVSSRHQRVVMDMLVRARNLLTKKPIQIAFFQTEDACRTWLAARNV